MAIYGTTTVHVHVHSEQTVGFILQAVPLIFHLLLLHIAPCTCACANSINMHVAMFDETHPSMQMLFGKQIVLGNLPYMAVRI
jgi:hypothetical protein